MKNVLFCLVVLLSAFIVGCNDEGQGEYEPSQSWAFEFVHWNSATYKVTDYKVDNIGDKIGVVETRTDSEAYSYDGTYSNKFNVGTEIYSIVDIDESKAIAVKSGDKVYLLLEKNIEDLEGLK